MSPDWKAFVWSNLPPLGLPPVRESEIVAELTAQFEQAYEAALNAGASEDEAASSAKLVRDWNALADEFRAAENAAPVRESSAGRAFTGMWNDLRYAARNLWNAPVFTLAAALTLSFGIGANTAIFTVVDRLAFRALPYPDSGRLINIDHTKIDQPEVDPWCSIDNFLEFRRRTQTFESIAGLSPVWNVVITEGGQSERLETLFVSAEFFPMLGVKPVLGRSFTPAEDDRAQPSRVALLSHQYWQRRFGGSSQILGKLLRIDGAEATVIGVLPEGFRWRGEPLAGTSAEIDLWMPLATNQLARSPRTLRFLKVTGRIKPEATPDQARDEIGRIGKALTEEFPEANKGMNFAGVSLESKVTAKIGGAVAMLLVSAGFMLLMASANVANLLLARAFSRRREISVRIALGASSYRLIRQLLTESGLLAIAGAVLGIAVARGLLALIAAFAPAAIARTLPMTPDARALAFTTAVAIATAVLSGLIPALYTVFGNLGATMREGRGVTRGHRRVRSAFAVAQIAIALVLAVGSGLLIRSFLRVLEIDPGFDPHNVATISLQVPTSFTRPEQRIAVYETLRNRLMAHPGVVDVGAVSRIPMLGQNLGSLLHIEGRDPGERPPEVEYRAATPSFFSAMRIPLKSGRMFDDRDGPNQPILLIDELTARRFFNGMDPVGKRLRFLADRSGPWYTVVGVVGSIRHFGLEADPRPTIYRPVIINPLSAPILVIRTAGDPSMMIKSLERTVSTSYAGMPAYNVFTMDALVANSAAQRRFLMWIVTAFGIGALLLAAIGTYGAVSQSVAQRTQEIGVRMALGASGRDTLRLVFAEGTRMASTGIAVGLAVSLAVVRLGRGLLYGVGPADAVVFLAAAGALFASVALACYAPAMRAARVDPLVTLRDT